MANRPRDRFLLAIAATVIVISFGIVVYFGVLSGFDIDPESLNQSVAFEQLEELNYQTREKILENPTLEQFRDLVGEKVEQVKERIVHTNNTNSTNP